MLRLLCASSALVLAFHAGTAVAADAADASGAQVEELIVTGEKADRSVQDTVSSVAVITAARIERENIQDFFDVVNRTANVSETYGPTGFTIRGISNLNVSGGGSSGLATVYLDGAPLPDRALHAAPLQMFDVRQVEILRGPQSTLQGRNALAGAVVIRTQDPTWTWSGRGQVMFTNEDERQLAFAGGGPIVADQLAFRIVVDDRKADGFVRNITRNEQEDPNDSTTIRTKLLFTPSAAPGLTVRAGWTHDQRKGGYLYSYSKTNVANPWKNRVAVGDYSNQAKNKADFLNLTADYELSDNFDLFSGTSWSKSRNVASYDQDSTPLPISYGDTNDRDQVFTQEVRLSYTSERLTGLVGAYYSKRQVAYDTQTLTNVTTPVATLIGVLRGAPFNLDAATANFAANTYAAALPVIPVSYSGVAPQEITTVALFADGRYQITPQLSLLAGFRYDREKNVLETTQTAVFAGTYPNPAAFGPLAPVVGGLNQVVGMFVAQAGASAPPGTRKFEAFLPKVGLKYDITDDASLSFMVQRGYRSGGATINIARSLVVAYDPEYTWNYEAALRTAWLDGALTVNANAYYVDWKDQQVYVNLGLNDYDSQTENAGKSHLYGFEVETAYRPSSKWGVYASLGHSRTKFDDFAVNIPGSRPMDLSGSEFAFAPRWTMAVGGDYRWDNGFVASANASFRDKAYSGTGTDQADYRIDARTLVNAKFGYETKHWAISAFANNLLDEAYVQYNQVTLNRAMFGDPRVLGAILEVKW